MKQIPVARPAFLGNEKAYVQDCMESQWISSIGKYIGRFEDDFAKWSGAKYAVGCCNGTAALHVALLALGVKPGDEIIVPTLTFVATVNAITMCGATPVFIDSEPNTWNLDIAAIERLITPRTRGIIPVHLYGYPVDMESLMPIAKARNIFVLEDAAEAHGAKVGKKMVGTFGDAAVFSFFGNKILTTGEGGMVTTDNQELSDRMRLLRGQGQDPNRRYWFPVVGYNYRITNIAAAIGVAQIERADEHIRARDEIAHWYRHRIRSIPGIRSQTEENWASPVCWLFTICLDESWPDRDLVMAELLQKGIETRPIFYPIHTLPPYHQSAKVFPVAEKIARSGLNLPTWYGMGEDQVDYIASALNDIRSMRRAA